ncbi:hypothetical protein SFUMM280S_00007 [Streptomyces fumanus]
MIPGAMWIEQGQVGSSLAEPFDQLAVAANVDDAPAYVAESLGDRAGQVVRGVCHR